LAASLSQVFQFQRASGTDAKGEKNAPESQLVHA
jgi:hypothetical protein